MKFTIIASELYRLGIDELLRRCVLIFARHLVITESHADDIEDHFAIGITFRKIIAIGLWWTTLYEDVKTI